MKKVSVLLLFIFSISIGIAQETKGKEIEFTTTDNIKISATYQLPKNIKKAPAVILIHQGGSTREEWKELTLWNKLIENGYAILAYDVRLHGKSAKDEGSIYDLFNNSKRAPLDLKAAINFLKKDKRIDKDRIGIIGASIGGNLAVVAAGLDDYNVKSVVVMSAKTSAAQNLSGKKTLPTPKNAFYIASKNEQKGARELWAKELYKKTTGTRKVTIAEGDKHGSFILRENKGLEKDIIKWIKETL